MIQRLQTLYLFLVVVCFALLSFLSPMQFMTTEGAEVQHLYEIAFLNVVDVTNAAQPLNVMSVWALAVLSIVIPLIALVSIFLYKKRIVQARLNAILQGRKLDIDGFVEKLKKKIQNK